MSRLSSIRWAICAIRVVCVEEISALHFILKQKPANLDAFQGTSYMGNIKPDAKVCRVSFPGKFQAGWESLIHDHNEDSVACVFLTIQRAGLGNITSQIQTIRRNAFVQSFMEKGITRHSGI